VEESLKLFAGDIRNSATSPLRGAGPLRSRSGPLLSKNITLIGGINVDRQVVEKLTLKKLSPPLGGVSGGAQLRVDYQKKILRGLKARAHK
jgi:hypothetical protein